MEIKHQRLPLLLTSHGEDSAKQSFYNLTENRYQTTCIPILCNKSVLSSAYGWLVLLDCTEGDLSGECCLWNPTSMEIIQLPEFEDPCPYNTCVLSKPPTEPDCFIVFNQYCFGEQTICRIGHDVVFNVKPKEKGYQVVAMVSFQGMIFGIIQPIDQLNYQFATFHMVGATLETSPLLIDGELPWEVPRPIRSWILLNENHLIESPCGNELLLVTKMSFHVYLDNAVHFRVFRVDLGKMECEELKILDGRTIFISYFGNGFCRYSESFGSAIKPNSIYFTHRNGSVLYVYDLDDRSTTMLQPYDGVDIDPKTSENYWVDIPNMHQLYSLV